MAPFFRCVTNGQQPTNSDTQPNEEGQVRVYGYHENLNQRISTGEQIECTTLLSVNVLTGDSMDVDHDHRLLTTPVFIDTKSASDTQ